MNTLLMPSPYESDEGHLIGRDPRTITADEWKASGIQLRVGLAAIRAKCIDCANTATEVRKCVQTDCPLWPLRMGGQPRGMRSVRSESA